MRFRFAALAAVCCLTATAHAQLPSSPAPADPPAASAPSGRHPEEGRPFIRTYAPLDVNAAGQNWSMVQDSRGVIYVGSQSGVIEFDGVNWRLIETPTLATTNAGLALMDRQRRRVMVLDRSRDLPSNAIYHVTTDREGAIWTAGERGIARIEFPAPATAFSEADGSTAGRI